MFWSRARRKNVNESAAYSNYSPAVGLLKVRPHSLVHLCLKPHPWFARIQLHKCNNHTTG